MNSNLSEHEQHYAPDDIEAAIIAALAKLDNHDTLTKEDLAGLDQFHTGGIEFTALLAQTARITPTDHVLDIGGGLGGPARWLASETGCDVTVVDLTEAYCRVGAYLTEQARLSQRVHFQQGDALQLPFGKSSFDVAWTQHSTMNIPDKASLYTQIHLALRPGGRLAFQEIVSGSGEALHLPTMWAHTETMNFLLSSDALRATLAASGFRELAWNDRSDQARVWFQQRQQAQASATPNPLGLQLLLGADTGVMLRNHVSNLQEERIRVIEGVFERV